MSNRTAVKSAFDGLRPSIVREPTRTLIKPQDESNLLQTPIEATPHLPTAPVEKLKLQAQASPSPSFSGADLLTKKRREVLVPVTFRIPQSLKERLNEVAKKHELNQTDLINQGIELNLQRYR